MSQVFSIIDVDTAISSHELASRPDSLMTANDASDAPVSVLPQPSLELRDSGNLQVTNGNAAAAYIREFEWSACSRDSVLILFGTVMGNSELLANRLAAAMRLTGYDVRVRDMARCKPSVLTEAAYVLIVTSTYGDGEPPEDAAPFWHAVVHGNRLDLSGVRFSLLALGNSTFDHFCRCGRELDMALERHGATRFYPRIDCDADYDSPARRWMEGVITTLDQEKMATVAA